MMILISAFLTLVLVSLYIRYFPVWGVHCLHRKNLNGCSITIVDVRDYNQSYHDPVNNAINIPIAYMKRYYNEISGGKIHIVASDHLEKNISIRFLRRKGYNVVGYTLTNCKCKQKMEQQTA
jgi:hypothetical protein